MGYEKDMGRIVQGAIDVQMYLRTLQCAPKIPRESSVGGMGSTAGGTLFLSCLESNPDTGNMGGSAGMEGIYHFVGQIRSLSGTTENLIFNHLVAGGVCMQRRICFQDAKSHFSNIGTLSCTEIQDASLAHRI